VDLDLSFDVDEDELVDELLDDESVEEEVVDELVELMDKSDICAVEFCVAAPSVIEELEALNTGNGASAVVSGKAEVNVSVVGVPPWLDSARILIAVAVSEVSVAGDLTPEVVALIVPSTVVSACVAEAEDTSTLALWCAIESRMVLPVEGSIGTVLESEYWVRTSTVAPALSMTWTMLTVCTIAVTMPSSDTPAALLSWRRR